MRLRELLPRGYSFTVVGIAVGVAGLVSLGAMAERITRFIEGGDRFVLGQISVAGEGMGMGTGFTAGGLLSAAKIREIAAVPGVSGVQAQVMLPLNTSTSHFLTLTQELIMGMDVSVPIPNRHYRELPVAAGRPLRPGDRRATVLGADFAASRHLRAGASVTLGGQEFTVVGILEKTFTAPDRFALVPHRGRARAVAPAGPAPRPGLRRRQPAPRRSQHRRGRRLERRRGSGRSGPPHPGDGGRPQRHHSRAS